jgi:muramoyltetrapeptide carboxypeptidase
VNSPLPVGIFAASSIVPQIELCAGLEHLRANGFDPRVASQVTDAKFIWPGTDLERAEAIFRLAHDPNIPILWAARGGYGAGRVLPLLDQLARERGTPPAGKLLVGYSDVTALHEYVRTRWNWDTLHAPMPAAANFGSLEPAEWKSILDYVCGRNTDAPWAYTKLEWLTDAPAGPIHAELVGGNLSLWAAMAGTPYAQSSAGKILFLEDVDEPFYRIDRMMVQLEQSGAFASLSAIVLGDFTRCEDENNQCLADAATGEKKPLRKVFEKPEAFDRIFGDVGRRLGIPIAQGLPVGHGPHYAALPLGAKYELTPAGKLQLLNWRWLTTPSPSARGLG